MTGYRFSGPAGLAAVPTGGLATEVTEITEAGRFASVNIDQYWQYVQWLLAHHEVLAWHGSNRYNKPVELVC